MSTVIPASEAAAVDQTGTSYDDPYDDSHDDSVEIHRDGPLSGAIGAVAAALAVGYLLRAVGSGSLLDWALFAAVGALGVVHLVVLVDARAPLMVIDHHGVRVRRGAHWQGVSWPEVDRVEHRPRPSMLRDGSLTVVDVDGRRLGVRLSLSTRLVGADWHEVTGALGDLTEGRAQVVEVAPPARRLRAAWSTSESAGVHTDDQLDHRLERRLDDEPHDPSDQPSDQAHDQPFDQAQDGAPEDAPALPEHLSPPVPVDAAPAPLREPVPGRRTDILLDRPTIDAASDDEPTSVIRLPMALSDTSTIVIAADRGPDGGDLDLEVAAPVVGVVLAEARTRLGLSVDQLADRTRIRPHVIEAIEVDRFESCGGDFYARGHLRTLSRVLGVEVAPLLADYDERYADAPIDPRRVFQAELSTGTGAVRGAGGGVNWSVLVAVVMAVVLVWSVARLVMDGPVQLSDQPVLNGSPGGKATLSGASSTKVPVSFTAVTGGARVIVRDARQQVVFDEQLAFMQTATVDVVPPVRISSTDGGLRVSVDGVDEGALGATGQDAQQTIVP